MDSFSELDLEHFETELDGHVGVLRIDRPPANAHNIDVILEFQDAIEAIRFDEDVRAAVLGSTSEKFFSSGYDVKALQEESADWIGYASQTSKETIVKMRTKDTIFTAAVNGHCMGGGLEFALACDFRFVGDDDSYNVGVPEVQLGLIPGEAGTQLLPRYVGRSKAVKTMVTGETLSPQEGYEIGLFDEIHDPEKLEEKMLEFAHTLAEKPNKAIGHTKLAVNEGMELPLWDALAHERELQNQLLGSDIAEEGVNAFLSKRDPDFLGVELGDKEPGSDE